ncbi:hypothetical protein BRC76_08695 [Halobacteriales archaeon QH_8_67_36]|nr:MAG: hypothetical protein BRC76_08695 [Halobacteriales archaeon QH_8_67_36]
MVSETTSVVVGGVAGLSLSPGPASRPLSSRRQRDDAERERRGAESLEQTEAFDAPHPDEPTMHPSVVDEK